MSEINYIILKNEIFGRYLVASRDIKQGEVIISENPILIGPPNTGFLACFNCCSKIETTFIYCLHCNTAVICKNNCPGNLHSVEECQILKEKKIKGRDFLENPQIIFPLRCLLLQTTNPQTWYKIMELESHIEVRRNTPIWRRHQVAVENILKDMNKLNEECIKEELVQKILGILDVNTFEVRLPESSLSSTNPDECLRGLYINAALMAHDCTGNTFLSVDESFVLTVKASVAIKKNSPIYFNYSNVLQGSFDRKQHLKQGKYFDCNCKRCCDPTELNTNISSLKCHKCPEGFVRIKEPTDAKSEWECAHCTKTFLHFLVNIIVEEGRRLIKELAQNDIKATETLYDKLLKTFHPNHFLLLELQQNLVGMYSCLPPNIPNLTKKTLICEKILQVLENIEPGISRIRAMTLYQLQSATIDLAHKKYRENLITMEELFFKLKEADKYLNDSLKILLHEPIKSPEGKMAHVALNELKMLRTSVADIQDDLLNKSIGKKNIKNVVGLNEQNIKKSAVSGNEKKRKNGKNKK